MRKFFTSLVLVGATALYVFYRSVVAAAPSAPVISNSTTGAVTTTIAAASSAPAAPKPPPGSTMQNNSAMQQHMTQMMSGYKDGSYTGSVVDAFYGLVQVKATIVNGAITDVAFLSYPNDRDTSRFINDQAMPMLTQEAIATQSANVNIISGATDTSLAFRQSLANALSQAKI